MAPAAPRRRPARRATEGHAHLPERLDAYAPGAWARVNDVIERLARAPSSPRARTGQRGAGHVAARRDLPFAANCTAVRRRDPPSHACAGAAACWRRRASTRRCRCCRSRRTRCRGRPRTGPRPAVETSRPRSPRPTSLVQVAEHVEEVATGISLAEAKVVVSGGRGVGSADGFGILEELAGLLDAAVGCSRVVTSAGWRPHTDQVGQTGTKVSPDLYIACGISGATQHIAGCKGAKKILAINSDAEAPILSSADYAVIGDLTEIVPAITRRAEKGALAIDVAGRSARARGGARGGRRAVRPPRQAARGPRPDGQADRALRRHPAPRPQRGRDRARPAQAVPATRCPA